MREEERSLEKSRTLTAKQKKMRWKKGGKLVSLLSEYEYDVSSNYGTLWQKLREITKFFPYQFKYFAGRWLIKIEYSKWDRKSDKTVENMKKFVSA